ncbi:MAG: hypothetical protein J7M38_13345 [Armatimonadetes bacterium]|nr:hypothetical protein [Armatimonadota bacterium]
MFEEHMEVWNPGMLVPGLTIQALMGEHVSRPRNPLIADCLFRAGHIERWGTGTTRMIRACEAAGGPAPIFEENDAGEAFVVRLGKIPQPLDHRLNERQMQALEYVRKHGAITNREYRELTGVGRALAGDDLKILVELKLLVRRGMGRATQYVIADE